jgi:hypothetical protein
VILRALATWTVPFIVLTIALLTAETILTRIYDALA